jgi:NADH-quinone oxidoreductase subunit C
MHSQILELLNGAVPGCNATLKTFVKQEGLGVGDDVIFVESKYIARVCQTLKSAPQFDFNVLQVITGTDMVDHFEVTYILASFSKNLELLLKVKLAKPTDGSLPQLDTVSNIWKAGNWQERECYDMIGINFVSHPDLRRILCPYDWEGYPLRKDYKVQEIYQGMKVNPEHKMNFAEREFSNVQDLAFKEGRQVTRPELKGKQV